MIVPEGNLIGQYRLEDRNINISVFCKGQTFFSPKMRMQGKRKGYQKDKRRMVLKIRNHEGSSGNSRTRQKVGEHLTEKTEMKKQKSDQLCMLEEDKSQSFSAYKTRSTPAGQFLSWRQGSAISLQVEPFESAAGNQKLNELFAISFFRENLKSKECLWLNSHLLTVTTAVIMHHKSTSFTSLE